MPINTDLLIAAPMLQDAFVDKDGTPMAGGTITCYQDNSRTTLKNWYYQSGTPGNYSYIRLPNPLTLSAAGTICDINGVDTIPFFYPYSELDQNTRQPYYITVVNYTQTNQITRQNFPFLGGEDEDAGQGSHENYIINNGFWRNVGTMTLTNVLNTVVMPSQHDGFQFPDTRFIKNIAGGLDTVTFTKFPLTISPILTDDITPEYYINHTCNNAPSGETQKCYQFPISLHVNTLASVTYTVTIQVQNVGGSGVGQNVIGLYILQGTGTGTTSPSPFLISSITASSAWTKYQFTATFPSTAGLTLSPAEDDALYLQVQMPLNTNCSINFTRPSIYLSNDAPTNSFETYDQVDAVINSPRVGDLRTGLSQFYPFGWVPMNDGTIGNAASNATSRANADTWRLFELMWSTFAVYSNGTTNTVAQMYNSAGAAVTYGASAIADFNANNQISLMKMLGRVMLGTVPFSIMLGSTKTTFTSTTNVISTATNVNFFNGMPVRFSGTGVLATNQVYYVTNFNGTSSFNIANSFANAMAGTIVTFANDTGTVVGGESGTTEGEYGHTQLAKEVGAHTHTASVALGQTPSTINGVGGANPLTTTGPTSVTVNANTPANTPFNITQPGTFMNIYIKL